MKLLFRLDAIRTIIRDGDHLGDPGKRSVVHGLCHGVCQQCFNLDEITWCGRCGKGERRFPRPPLKG